MPLIAGNGSRNKTVLLINPPEERRLPDNKRKPFLWAGDVHAPPPINLLYLASNLRRSCHGIDVMVKDYAVDPYTQESFTDLLERVNPIIIGVTCFSTSLYPTIATCEAAKAWNPGLPVAIGGPHALIFPRETVQLPSVDLVCQGEGERALAAVVDCLLANRKIEGIPNIWIKENGLAVAPPKIEEAFAELNDTPPPDYSLIDLQRYFHPFLTREKGVIPVLAGRGCPHQCTFCNSRSRRSRVRHIDSVVDEIADNVSRHGIRNIMLLDDTFNLTADRVIRFCNKILERNLSIDWAFRGRVDGLNEEAVRLAKRAGLVHVALGVEDFSNEGLRKIKKNTTIEQIRHAFELCKRYGIQTTANFIIGLPHNQDIRRQSKIYSLIQELDPTTIQTYPLMLLPGSELYAEAVEKRIVDGAVWERQAADPQPGFAIPSWEEGMTFREQVRFNVSLNRWFYVRPGYLLDRLLEIRNFVDLFRKIKVGIRLLSSFISIHVSRR